MSVFGRTIEIKWGEDTYKCKVSMELVESIEANGISLLEALNDLSPGRMPKVSTVATVYQCLLAHAGKLIDKEEIADKFLVDAVGGSVEMRDAASAALTLFFPELETPERAEYTEKK